MKIIVSIIIALIMLLSFVACGDIESATPPAAEVESIPATAAPSNDPHEESPQVTESSQAAIEFQEIIVVDNEDCSIKITGIDEDNLWGYTLKALLENKTEDKVLMFSVNSAAINGVKADPLFASEVAAGKKSNEEISFATDTLQSYGILEFTDLELSFRVYDSEDWSVDSVAEATCHVYPNGEEHAERYIREAQPTDAILVDNDYATVILIGCAEDDFWGYGVNLFIVNKTDTSIMASVNDASINGFMLDPFYAESVDAGKVAFSTISWFDTDLEDNSIENVENIEFVLRIYDEENWNRDDFYNELVTITP